MDPPPSATPSHATAPAPAASESIDINSHLDRHTKLLFFLMTHTASLKNKLGNLAYHTDNIAYAIGPSVEELDEDIEIAEYTKTAYCDALLAHAVAFEKATRLDNNAARQLAREVGDTETLAVLEMHVEEEKKKTIKMLAVAEVGLIKNLRYLEVKVARLQANEEDWDRREVGRQEEDGKNGWQEDEFVWTHQEEPAGW